MQEKTTAPVIEPHSDGNLSDIPARNARQRPRHAAFARKIDSAWVDVTTTEFLTQVRAIAKGLMACGIEPGDRVALMSRTRYEWTLCDFAIWTAGAVTVPIYETSSAHQVDWILTDSAAKGIVTELDRHTQIVEEVRGNSEALQHVWQIEGGGLDGLVEAGKEVSDQDLDRRRSIATRDDLATIIYTSGTTGRPKGCELTHGNFMSLSENAIAKLPEVVGEEGARMVLFLPLAHVLARFIQVLAVDSGVKVGHAPDIKKLMDDLKGFQPTFVLAVPRVFEKIYNMTDQKLAAENKGRLFRLAAKIAIAHSRAMDEGGAGLPLKVQHKVLDILVYSKLRDAMGGKVQYAISGGGPLGERLGHFFRGIGINILEGYGLTETTAPTNVGLPSLSKIGTVGVPLPGVGIRIADDGEIQARGVGVFRGYFNNPEATAEVFTEDGWFQTGDIGSMDSDGCLRITGRKKEIIVTAGGKNVAPAVLEDVVRAHPLVSQCVVVGDNRPFVGALLTLDGEMIEAWAKGHHRQGLTLESARTDDYVMEHLQHAIDNANKHVSQAESIRKWAVLPTDFTEENGYLTPSMKLKRQLITTDYASAIDDLYGGPVESI
ncbi:MAG: long-chain fatty acid--CoA ligase [Austwickia sp.]|jgi:long-chain acyl-CoA synthetase|nr:long-chain fatty acid--CoA ligase [Austwickia sp.]MBK8435587.1 long-chain fatty acid--CoA ligase [Austwickia sp.]MBK9100843.1 long-chain fatty acid--CoA ligase [Austwickia sp.]